MGGAILTFIVLACNINVSVATEDSKGCKVFEQEVYQEGNGPTSPFACMIQSPVQLVKLMEEHPGYQPRHWTCRVQKPTKKI